MQSSRKRHLCSEAYRPQRSSDTNECAILTAIEGALLDTTPSRSCNRDEGAPRHRFSEPFLVKRGNITDVAAAAASLGCVVNRGRTFFYLSRQSNFGEAFELVSEEFGGHTIIGVGASAIDAEYLARADVAVVVPAPDGRPDPELSAKVPNAIVAPAPGHAGWAAAIAVLRNAFPPADEIFEVPRERGIAPI